MSNHSRRGRSVATVILAVLAIVILGVLAFIVGRAGFSSLRTGSSDVSRDSVVTLSTDTSLEENVSSAEEAVSSVASVPESVSSAAESTDSAAESVASTAEHTYPDTVYANGYDINIRASASTDAEVLGIVQRGEALTRTGEEGEWSVVEYNGTTGYVKTEFLTTTETYNTTWDLSTLDTTAYNFGYSSANRDANNVPTDWQWYESKWGQFNVDWIQDTSQNVIYLTMDEGFGNDTTAGILDTLKEKNVKAVFFLTKNFVDEEPDMVQRMIDEGHTLGNHTCTHPDMTSLSLEDQTSQVQTLQDEVKSQFGYTMKLFRFPEGIYSDETLGLVNNLGLKAVFWSYAYVDYDTANQPDVQESLNAAVSALHPGAIYLLHASSTTNAAMLGDFIDEARAAGFEFGTYPLDAN